MDDIRRESKDAFLYLSTIKTSLWASSFSVYPRFGHDTSNIIETINGSWSDLRQMPPLQAMDKIYLLTTKMVYDRFHRTQKSPYLANTPMAKFQARVQTSRRYQVLLSGNNLFQVQVPDSSKKYVVNL